LCVFHMGKVKFVLTLRFGPDFLILQPIMKQRAQRISYHKTGRFSSLVNDYLSDAPALRPFYAHRPDIAGIEAAIAARKQFKTDRALLTSILKEQYAQIDTTDAVKKNLDLLMQENCFVVTTAHQPNLFTGPLYFIYKILHAIQLSETLHRQLPAYHFVPVFYMGSEDADLEELAHCFIGGEKYEWNTTQAGAFGRMHIDDALIALIEKMHGQIAVLPNGKAWVDKLRKYFVKGASIQQATFGLVNDLFASYGLVIMLPDHAAYKQKMIPVFESELFEQRTATIVGETSAALEQHYKVQATGRAINLFYLHDQLRSRIEATEDGFAVANTSLRFTQDEMKALLHEHPERFSPNVMLRGMMQEIILPGIAFIGGGGELAYWMQLKSLFEAWKIPYPVLVLRNSFLLLEQRWMEKIAQLGFDIEAVFNGEQDLMDAWVKRNVQHALSLEKEIGKIQEQYQAVRNRAETIDATLVAHAEALEKHALKALQSMQQKMLRAEKRKHADTQRQIQKIKTALFPHSDLQERVENIAYFYSMYGAGVFDLIYEHSGALEQQFTIVQLDQ